MQSSVTYEMAIAPLRMERCFFPRVHLEADPAYGQSSSREAPLTMDTAVTDIKIEQIPGDHSRFMVVLDLRITWPNAEISPYSDARLQAVGIFFIDPSIGDALRKQHLIVGAPSMLYSSAREHFRALTASGPWGEIIIPGMVIKVASVTEAGGEASGDG